MPQTLVKFIIFLWLNSFYIHLPAVFLLRKVGGNMLLNIIWYLGKNLLSYGRNCSPGSRHIVGYSYANCSQFKKGIIVQTVRFIRASLWNLVLYFKSSKFTIKFVFISYAEKYFAVTGSLCLISYLISSNQQYPFTCGETEWF